MQTLNNLAMCLGYLMMLVIISLASWHAVAAYRRYRAGREERLRQRAHARVESESVSLDDRYQGADLGI